LLHQASVIAKKLSLEMSFFIAYQQKYGTFTDHINLISGLVCEKVHPTPEVKDGEFNKADGYLSLGWIMTW
jgi:hypothetical protein